MTFACHISDSAVAVILSFFIMSKKIIFFLFLFFAKINIAFADFFANFNPVDPPGDLIGLIIWLFIYAVIIGFFILIVILIRAGLLYLTSIGNPEKRKNALTDLKYGFLGIGILVASVLFLITLNPELLRPRLYLERVPVYILPALPMPADPRPPRVYLRAKGSPKEKIFKVGIGQKFSLEMKLYGEITSCRSLGVRSVHPIDVRFDLEVDLGERDFYSHEKFFEVWQGGVGGGNRWWAWRIERNTFAEKYAPKRKKIIFMEWGGILFHENHLKSDIESIKKIMEKGNYDEMPLKELFGPGVGGCQFMWEKGSAIFGHLAGPCSNPKHWVNYTNNFTNQDALIRLEQRYGRIPYRYLIKGLVFYYANPERGHEISFIPEYVNRKAGKWSFPPASQNLVFDYPGIYTFKVECVGPWGSSISETSIAVFNPPEITVTTPTFTAYTNQKITIHLSALDAKTCRIEEPGTGWWTKTTDWGKRVKRRITREDYYDQREALVTYIFETIYVKFTAKGNHQVKIECEGPGGKNTKSIWIRIVDSPTSP